ncbi:hypothetical protein Lser_V15G06630 [Lactuca serriola]
MKLFQAYSLLIIVFLSFTATSTAGSIYSKAGCARFCGEVQIPYPFGIGVNCSVSEWYAVDCNSSTPYLSALNNLEVLEINVDMQMVAVNVSLISDYSIDLGRSPFLFSRLHNRFVVRGCGNAVILDHGGVITGCSTICTQNDTLDDICRSCETTIPHYLKSYKVDLAGLERLGGDGNCGYAYLADRSSRIFGRYSGYSDFRISLLWTISDRDFHKLSCCSKWHRLKFDLGDGTSVESWKCNYSLPYNASPYLLDGCKNIEECSSCRSDGRVCNYGDTYDDDGVLSSWNFTCSRKGHNGLSKNAILGVSISIGVIFLLEIISFSYNIFQKTKARRQRRRFFKRNGGLLLKQQQEADPSLVDKTILFTSQEMEKATDCFNENRILGRGGQGTVYKGMLVDGRIVAVKRAKLIDESQLEQFINEVVILSKVNHRNVVKLIGCCLETEVPLLVSEFISNGTLYKHIHYESDEYSMSLNTRLQIATEVASAVAYLHSATSIPIYHRDIKSTNILLDDKYRAKVSDFGTSRIVSMDQTHLTTLVKGTFGYLDPEYFQSSQFTEKSDVYSFGVVLVELLTGEKPISLTRFGEDRNLAMYFKSAMEEKRVMSIFDATMIKEGTRDELLLVANLAMRCLNNNGKNRPTMKEVAMKLETIRTLHVPSMVQTNMGQLVYKEELAMQTYGESSSTFMSFDDNNASQ